MLAIDPLVAGEGQSRLRVALCGIGAVLCLLLAACGDDAGSGVTTTSAPGSVVPEALCTNGPLPSDVYFAALNTSDRPVVIDDPARNVVTGDADGDEPLAPTVFAAGRTSPAFVMTTQNDQASWTLVGPDGASHTATVDAGTPLCTGALLRPTTPDDRKPVIRYAVTSEASSATVPTEVTVMATVTDLPDQSVCADGLEPSPPLVWLTFDGVAVTGRSVAHTLQFTSHPSAQGTATVTTAQADVGLYVVDICSADGATSRSWASGDGFALMGLRDELLCVEFADGKATVDPDGTNCPTLAFTGGQRIRVTP